MKVGQNPFIWMPLNFELYLWTFCCCLKSSFTATLIFASQWDLTPITLVKSWVNSIAIIYFIRVGIALCIPHIFYQNCKHFLCVQCKILFHLHSNGADILYVMYIVSALLWSKQTRKIPTFHFMLKEKYCNWWNIPIDILKNILFIQNVKAQNCEIEFRCVHRAPIILNHLQ